jgi:hypothetical protein
MKFQVTLLSARGADDATTIHRLRALLKILLRRYGFRVIDAREVQVRDRVRDDHGTRKLFKPRRNTL